MSKTIDLKLPFTGASARQLYNQYLSPRHHAAFIGGKVSVEKHVGSAFSAYDGYIKGKILHLAPSKLIVQTWRGGDWDKKAPNSVLVMRFVDFGDGAVWEIAHSGVPEAQRAECMKGWRSYYWRPWKRYLAGAST